MVVYVLMKQDFFSGQFIDYLIDIYANKHDAEKAALEHNRQVSFDGLENILYFYIIEKTVL